MQEHQVTAGANTFDLEPPFFVLATQNPIEQEGTYPLPEAQLDRFMLSINIGYPDAATRSGGSSWPPPRPRRRRSGRSCSGRDMLWIQQLVREVPASDHMVDYAVDLVRATRPKEPGALDFIKNWLAWGAGPRAAQYIDPGGQGPGHPPRPPGRQRRRHPRRGPARPAAPHLHQLQRRRRGGRRRSDHRQDPPDRARAELRRARGEGRRIGEAIRSSQDQVGLLRRPSSPDARLPTLVECLIRDDRGDRTGDACLIPRQLTIPQTPPE